MENKYLSTGQAAEMLSVTSDTVLKWIKKGKLEAIRTAGGHYRTPISAVMRFLSTIKEETNGKVLEDERVDDAGMTRNQDTDLVEHLYCWEFIADDSKVNEQCQNCLVFRAKAMKCYEMADLGPRIGHQRLFCQVDCEHCDYYKIVNPGVSKILVLSNDKELTKILADCIIPDKIDVRISDCLFETQNLINQFQPSHILIDYRFLKNQSIESLVQNKHLMDKRGIIADGVKPDVMEGTIG